MGLQNITLSCVLGRLRRQCRSVLPPSCPRAGCGNGSQACAHHHSILVFIVYKKGQLVVSRYWFAASATMMIAIGFRAAVLQGLAFSRRKRAAHGGARIGT